ncbi:MAG: protein-export chaperone SecB [Burkholderiaceae bacterium]|jgi:preprotein translocase subunit SecB|nr:protein-export chaperone SecB [Burkholderiaceae bacterium]
MADSQPAQTQSTAPVFNIQRMYLKEASLEQPNSPAILLQQEQPSVEITLHVAAEPVEQHPDVHEVTVMATVHTKIKDKTLFLVECKQAGIFEIRNLPEAQLAPVLNVVCPQIVYPYLRSNVADVIVRGGFPPVHLAEINFQAMYEQQQAQQNAAQTQNGKAAAPAAPAAPTSRKQNG